MSSYLIISSSHRRSIYLIYSQSPLSMNFHWLKTGYGFKLIPKLLFTDFLSLTKYEWSFRFAATCCDKSHAWIIHVMKWLWVYVLYISHVCGIKLRNSVHTNDISYSIKFFFFFHFIFIFTEKIFIFVVYEWRREAEEKKWMKMKEKQILMKNEYWESIRS